MSAKSMELVWIVVKDLKAAIKFYTEVVGLELKEKHDEFGWAELQGKDGGARLGIAQACPEHPDIEPGGNAFVTFTVADLGVSLDEMKKLGVKTIGEVQEVPGHVKMQMIADADGNRFQLVQKLG